MKNFLRVNFSIVLIFFILNIINIKADEKVEGVSVRVKPKQFNGFIKEVKERKVNVFLGIPYAKPPIGELRFKKPIPYEYDQPIDATKWPNPCSQSKIFAELMPLLGNKNYSEDCLYLNIWSPIDSEESGSKKPVLFWIHGGGLAVGASNWDKTEGEVLAAFGDVVVVTINYRLKQLGFLYTGSNDAPGNAGLWDQAMALKWVNEHISYFGGDPNQITIIGESAGSWSVSLHLLSPITRNLFKNAIMMSGAALFNFYGRKDDVKKMWSKMADSFGCKEDFDRGSTQCLRGIEANNLTESEMKLDLSDDKAFVIYGDEFLPQKPIDMIRSGNYKKNVNLLMGTTDDEGSLLLTFMVNRTKFSISDPENITKSEAKEFLDSIFTKVFPIDSIKVEDIYNLYISQLSEDNFDAIRRSLGVALGDYALTCPTIQFGKLLFSGDSNNSRVYHYLWSAKYDKTWHGADHGSEVEYFFGSPFRETNTTDESFANKHRVSLKLIEILSHFTRNGYKIQ
jgi:carboxylesterase type B